MIIYETISARSAIIFFIIYEYKILNLTSVVLVLEYHLFTIQNDQDIQTRYKQRNILYCHLFIKKILTKIDRL